MPASARLRSLEIWAQTWSRFALGVLSAISLITFPACMPGEPIALKAKAGVDLPPGGEGHAVEGLFEESGTCKECHPRQFREWSGSMMAYSAHSPTFNAFEALANSFTNGAFRKGGAQENFCARCHSPVGDETGQIPEFQPGEPVTPVRDGLGPTASQGVSCVSCHQAIGPDHERSPLGDGISNTALVLEAARVRQGPIEDPVENGSHVSEFNPYLRTGGFCGACHDVRLAIPDKETGEDFSRLENAFTEWERSPYNSTQNPYGRRVTCQDCHMSLYPYAAPGTYPLGKAAELKDGTELPTRRLSTHYFTGADVALVKFPGQDDAKEDDWGMPRGQKQRRRDLIRSACVIDLLETPEALDPSSTHLPVTVNVTNVGAGHGVPTGFSQEREVWIELIVEDAVGTQIYETGTLRDSAHPETGEDTPDGRLEDEDLRELVGRLDPHTFEVIGEEPGPDARDEARQLGLVTFTNHFERNGHRVDVPLLADHFNNSRSLPPLETVRVPYRIPLPRGLVGPLTLRARLRFRHFPPRFLRMLAEGRPDLVTEATVDQLEIIDMAESRWEVRLGE